jgi:hypothetical protein
VDNPENKPSESKPATEAKPPEPTKADAKKAPEDKKRESKMCAFDPTQKAISECHKCNKPLGKTALFKVNKKSTCVECLPGIKAEIERQPLSFGRWFKGGLVASLFVLVPLGLWAAALAWLVSTDGPKDEGSVKLFGLLDQLFPMVGFLVLVLVGYGWRIGTGKSRGGSTMLWAALQGILLLVLLYAANFIVMDNYYYPYYGNNTAKGDTSGRLGYYKYIGWVNTMHNQRWVPAYNEWIKENDQLGSTKLKALAPSTQTVADFKKWYYEDFNSWVDKVVEYNAWVALKGSETKLMKLEVPEKHMKMPSGFSNAMKYLPEYAKLFPARFKAHNAEMGNAALTNGVTIVLWIFGLLFGALWLPRSRYLVIVPPGGTKKETKLAASESKPSDAQSKPEEKPAEKK